MVRQWQRLPKEVLDAVSLEVFKARLHGALSNLGYWKLSLPMQEWNQMDFNVPSNPNASMTGGRK